MIHSCCDQVLDFLPEKHRIKFLIHSCCSIFFMLSFLPVKLMFVFLGFRVSEIMLTNSNLVCCVCLNGFLVLLGSELDGLFYVFAEGLWSTIC